MIDQKKLGVLDDLMYAEILRRLQQSPEDISLGDLEAARKYLSSRGYSGIAHAPKDDQGHALLPELDPEIVRNLRAI